MKLNYKDTLQYVEDAKSFKLLLAISITYSMIFFLLFLGVYFFLKNESTEIALTVCLSGIFLYFILDLPLIIKTIAVKRNMNLTSKYINQIYVFKIQFNNPTNHWFSQSKFSLSFEYNGETKTLDTSWIYDSNNLTDSLVEVGYIKELKKVIIIKKAA